MTRAEIRTLIYSWLDDDAGGYFTPAQVNTWINLAHRQVQMLLLQAGENYYMKPVETMTVAGQPDYVLPADFMVEHRLEYVAGGTGPNEDRQQISPITTNQQDYISIGLGNPSNYYIKKDRFTLSPTPAQAWLLRLYYSPMVQDLANDSDVPDVPEQYMEYVAVLAAFNGFIKDDRAPQTLQAKMIQLETLLKQMAEDRNQDQSRQVVQVTDYDNFGGFY
jgi:hypothetical protein